MWPSTHGITALYNAEGNRAVNGNESSLPVKNILLNPQDKIEYKNLIPVNGYARSTTDINSIIISGNLTIFANLLSTPFQPNGDRRFILLAEDVGGTIRSLDRFLDQILYSDIGNYLDGIILGDFKVDSRELIEKFLTKKFGDNVKIPVFYYPKIGHGKYNSPIILNVPVSISKDDGDFILQQ